MSQEIENSTDAIAALLTEHSGQDTVVLDLREVNNWTDFFVITTAASKTHIDGLERHVKEFCHEQGIDIIRSTRKDPENEWQLIDLGFAIVHLMTKSMREFYELERLWHYSSPKSSSSSSSSQSSSSS